MTKECHGCHRVLPLAEYGQSARARDGLQTQCRECMAQRQRREFVANPEGVRAKSRRYRARHLDEVRERNRIRHQQRRPEQRMDEVERVRAWRERTPGAHKAHMTLEYAIRSGRLERPSECSACGAQGRIHGHHHHGYSDPLDVVWLCAPCHRAAHKALDNVAVPGRLEQVATE